MGSHVWSRTRASVDLHHSANPPTHPEVLELLATEFRTHEHDVPWLLREIALTKTWQRSFRLPDSSPKPVDLRDTVAKVQQQAEAQEQQAGEFDSKYETLLEQVDTTVTEAKPVFDAEIAAMKKIEEVMKPRTAVKTKFDAAKSKAEKSQKLLTALKESASKAAAAAKLLSDDSLSKSVATLNDRAKKQEAGLPKLLSALKAEQKKLSDADAKVTEASRAADPMIAATRPIDEKIRQLRRDAYEQRLKAQALRTQAEANSLRAQQLSAIAKLTSDITSISEHMVRLKAREMEVAGLHQQTKSVNERLTAAKATYQQMSTTADAMNRQLRTSSAALVAIEQQRQKIEAAIQSVSDASAGLPGLTETGEAIGALQAIVTATTRKTSQQKATVKEAQQQLLECQSCRNIRAGSDEGCAEGGDKDSLPTQGDSGID